MSRAKSLIELGDLTNKEISRVGRKNWDNGKDEDIFWEGAPGTERKVSAHDFSGRISCDGGVGKLLKGMGFHLDRLQHYFAGARERGDK